MAMFLNGVALSKAPLPPSEPTVGPEGNNTVHYATVDRRAHNQTRARGATPVTPNSRVIRPFTATWQALAPLQGEVQMEGES